MPKKKAPGPDGITAELITAGGQPAKEMTDRLIKKCGKPQKFLEDSTKRTSALSLREKRTWINHRTTDPSH